jgi:hypothetical protein
VEDQAVVAAVLQVRLLLVVLGEAELLIKVLMEELVQQVKFMEVQAVAALGQQEQMSHRVMLEVQEALDFLIQ